MDRVVINILSKLDLHENIQHISNTFVNAVVELQVEELGAVRGGLQSVSVFLVIISP